MGLNSGGPKEGEELSSSRKSKAGGAAQEPPAGLPADLTIARGHCGSEATCPSSREYRNVGAFFIL